MTNRPARSRFVVILITAGLIAGSLGVRSAAQTALELSPEAAAHLSEIVFVMQREWLHRAGMDWAAFERRVLDRAGAARSIADTHNAIRLALSMLADRHSHYVPAAGAPVFNPQSPTQSTGECTPSDPTPVQVPSDVGYVRVQVTPPTSKEAIQDALRNADGPNVVGWIVDLRNSRGGNMWPAVAGLGSLLGEGTAGFFVDAGNRATRWGYAESSAFLGDRSVETVTSPYRLSSKTRVAVLTDVGVASSGEAIAIAFRARPNTRSFGTPTCGLSTAVNQFPLKTGGRIALVVATMADRTMTKY